MICFWCLLVLDSPEASLCNGEVKEDTNQSATVEQQNVGSRVPGDGEINNFKLQAFGFSELVAATNDFNIDNVLGEGGFGKVHKGLLADTGQVRPIG